MVQRSLGVLEGMRKKTCGDDSEKDAGSGLRQLVLPMRASGTEKDVVTTESCNFRGREEPVCDVWGEHYSQQ